MLCLHCQAENQASDARCWLCGEAIGEEIVEAKVVGPAERRGISYTLTAFLVLVSLVVVGVGVWDQAPGLALLLWVVVSPAVVATLGRVYFRRRRGETISGWKTLLDFILSAAICGLIAFVLAAIAIVCFIAYIFYICTGGGSGKWI